MTLAASTSSEVPGPTSSAARLASTTPRPPGVTGRQRHHHHQGVRRHVDADTCCVAARDKDRVIGLLADQQRLLASTESAVLATAALVNGSPYAAAAVTAPDWRR